MTTKTNNIYKYKIETLDMNNETIDTMEYRTKRAVKKALNSYNFPSHYRTIKKRNDKLIKSLSRIYKLENGIEYLLN